MIPAHFSDSLHDTSFLLFQILNMIPLPTSLILTNLIAWFSTRHLLAWFLQNGDKFCTINLILKNQGQVLYTEITINLNIFSLALCVAIWIDGFANFWFITRYLLDRFKFGCKFFIYYTIHNTSLLDSHKPGTSFVHRDLIRLTWLTLQNGDKFCVHRDYD